MTTFAHLSNHELLAEVKRLAAGERQATAHLIASLMEVDARRLYLGEGCSSLFTYCTQVLHLSEHAAYGRIEAARAARRFPQILELLAGDPATIFDRALTLLITELERTRLAATNAQRRRRPTTPTSRHIPADVKRAVWTRDAGRCAFIGAHGRCTETGFLEFHHVMPYARGGPAIVANIQLRCAAHNAYEAELDFGTRQAALVRENGPPYALA